MAKSADVHRIESKAAFLGRRNFVHGSSVFETLEQLLPQVLAVRETVDEVVSAKFLAPLRSNFELMVSTDPQALPEETRAAALGVLHTNQGRNYHFRAHPISAPIDRHLPDTSLVQAIRQGLGPPHPRQAESHRITFEAVAETATLEHPLVAIIELVTEATRESVARAQGSLATGERLVIAGWRGVVIPSPSLLTRKGALCYALSADRLSGGSRLTKVQYELEGSPQVSGLLIVARARRRDDAKAPGTLLERFGQSPQIAVGRSDL